MGVARGRCQLGPAAARPLAWWLGGWPYRCLQDKLEAQDEDAEDMRDHQAELEGQLKDALERNSKYQEGVYGLPQVRAGQVGQACRATG